MPLISPDGTIITNSGYDTGLSKPSVPWSANAGDNGIVQTDGYTVSYSEIFETQPWVASATTRLAYQIARLPLKVYRHSGDEGRERVRGEKLDGLLRRPREGASAAQLKQWIATPWLVHGNAVLFKRRGGVGQPPSELVPLKWSKLRPILDGATVIGWIYADGESWIGKKDAKLAANERLIAATDVIHFKWEGPDGGPLGVSPLKQLGVTLKAEQAAQAYTEASFRNGARPGLGLVMDPSVELTQETIDLLRQQFRDGYSGANANRPVVLGGGVQDLKTFAHTPHEAELIEARKVNRDEIAAVYGVPQPLVGILDHATYSNVTEMHKILYVTTLGPWLTVIAETLEAQLIAPESAWAGMYCEFDLGEVLKGDTGERMGAYETALRNGILTINEVRSLENRPKFDNPLADQPLIQANNTAPLGDQADSEQVIKSALERAATRLFRRAQAGAVKAWDSERFERELKDDLEPITDAAAALAERVTAAAEAAVAAAGGPAEQREALLGLDWA